MQEKKSLGVVICTHSRVEDAKINQEIIKEHWPREADLGEAVIIHCYNGKREWYPEPYLEDDLLRCNNSNLSQGNADLIDTGIKYLHQQYPDIRYAVVLNADTWLLKPAFLSRCVKRMAAEHLVLAASSYVGEKSEFFRGGLASDFFIIDVEFAMQQGMIPLNYKEFEQKHWEALLYYCSDMSPILEKLLMARFAQALHRAFPSQNPGSTVIQKLLRMTEREPFYHPGSDTSRVWHWPEAGVVSDHNLASKQELLKQEGITQGYYISQFLDKDLMNWASAS